MSGILVIGVTEQHKIDRAIKKARERPKPWAVFKEIARVSDDPMFMLKDRRTGIDTEKILRMYPSRFVQLGTYRAQISFEEQPAGLFKHISVSSQAKDKVPGPEVMQMVCEAFGFSDGLCRAIGRAGATIIQSDLPVRIWLEEFEPGRMAINVTEMEPAERDMRQ